MVEAFVTPRYAAFHPHNWQIELAFQLLYGLRYFTTRPHYKETRYARMEATDVGLDSVRSDYR